MAKTNGKKKANSLTPREDGKPHTKRELCVYYHSEGHTSPEIAELAGTTLNSVRWYLSKEKLRAHRADIPKKE